MTDRARRCRRRLAPCSLVQGRDLEALRSLARARFLTTTQLERLHYGGSRRVAQRRLRTLLDHGLVSGALQSEQLHRASIFRPTVRGLEVLADRGHELDIAKPARLPKPGKLRHSIAVRDVFVAALQLEERGVWTLDDVLFDSQLASDPVLRAAKLVPDVLVRTRAKLGADGRLIFVELDLGSEPLTTLAAKLDSYDALRAGAIEYAEAQALFVVVGDGRRRRVEALVAERRVRVVAPQDIADALAACSRNVFARPRRGERTAGGVQLCKVATVSGLRKVGV